MASAIYPAIKKELEKRIREGVWSERLPGILALAKEFNVSHQTIIKAIRLLEKDGSVVVKDKQGTFIVKDGSHRPDSPFICVIGYSEDPNILLHKYREIDTLRTSIRANGLQMLSLRHYSESDVSLAEVVARMGIGGCIFTNSFFTREMVELLLLKGVPFVYINRIASIPGVSWVDFDQLSGLRAILTNFINKGHKRIAMATRRAPFLVTYNEDYFNTYRDVMKENDIFDEKLLHYFNNDLIFDIWESEGASIRLAESIFNKYFRSDDYPTAIYIDNFITADKFIQTLRARRPDIAGTVEVGSCMPKDKFNENECGCSEVLLMDLEERARKGVELLMEQMNSSVPLVKNQLIPIESKTLSAFCQIV